MVLVARVLAVVMLASLVMGYGPSVASASPQINCRALVPWPYNSVGCPIPARFSGREVYVQAYPEMVETSCGSPRTTAQVHAQIAVVRYSTGFKITGLWLEYMRGQKPYGFFQATVEDGQGHDRNGTWNNNGTWMTTDWASRGGGNPTRFFATPTRPVPVTWQGNGIGRVKIWLSEHDTPNFYGSGYCNVFLFYVAITATA